jgi:hypothetical protein
LTPPFLDAQSQLTGSGGFQAAESELEIASPVLSIAFRWKICFGEMAKPACETRALPRSCGNGLRYLRGAQAASLQPSAACRRNQHFGW